MDEAHERSVHTDVLLGLLKGVLAKRGPSFRLVIMSATLDAGKFARFFGDCPVAHVLGRTYPVEVQYTPTPEDDYLDACINTVLQVRALHNFLCPLAYLHASAAFSRSLSYGLGWTQIHSEEGPGDILVFLTGQEEIEAAERLLREKAESLEVR